MITNINLQAAQLGKVSSVTQTNRAGCVQQAAPQSDTVSISDSAKAIMQSVNDTGTPVDIDKVTQLQMLIQSGNYTIESDKIAQQLIQDAREL